MKIIAFLQHPKIKVGYVVLIPYLVTVLSCCTRNVEKKGYFTSGKLKWVGEYKYDKKDGKYQEYYENGELKILANFVSGLQIDTIKYYLPNGSLEYSQFWRDGLPVNLITSNGDTLTGNGDFYEKNIVVHNKMEELKPSFQLEKGQKYLIENKPTVIKFNIPNFLRPHNIQASGGKIKPINSYGALLITPNLNTDTLKIFIKNMTIDSFINLPTIKIPVRKK